MGQAAYDAQVEFFRANNFYDETSKSPFLIVQPQDSVLRRLAIRLYPPLNPHSPDFSPQDVIGRTHIPITGGVGIALDSLPVDDLELSRTIDQIEDHYIAAAPTRNTDRELSIFAVNAQESIHGSINKRGTGWIVLMHPDRFKALLDTMNVELMTIWENVFSQDERLNIGRWSLAANKVDRCQHIWVAEHFPRDEIATVWRETKASNMIDGIPVMETHEGFHYPNDAQENYILRWKYST